MRRSAATVSALHPYFTDSGKYWLAVAAIIGAIAWYKSINVVLIVVYAMIVLLVLNGLLAWLNVRRVSAKRLAVLPLFAGERSEYGVRVANDGMRPITVTVEDHSTAGTTNFLAYRVPPQQSVNCTASREFATRGRFSGPLTVVSSFPFGFLQCERAGDASGEIVVLPRPGFAESNGLRRWFARQAGSDGRARKVQRRVTTNHAEVRGVRDYRTGDAIRDIHWRSTARRGEAMVREYDTAPSAELVLVVEPWLPANPTPADHDRLEDTLSLAVTIAVTWRKEFDSPVTVVVPGPVPAITTANSDDDLREALTPLADATGGPMPEALPPAAFAGRLARGARIIVSSRIDTPYAGVLARSTGKPFAAVCPTDRLLWYQTPRV